MVQSCVWLREGATLAAETTSHVAAKWGLRKTSARRQVGNQRVGDFTRAARRRADASISCFRSRLDAGRHFEQLVTRKVGQRDLERHRPRRAQPRSIVLSRGSDVGQLLAP